ncbi:MAG: M23 family metallopeptidase [Sphingobacteriaceae bacterium]|nr:M23 family metallopeptidase [Sphingobacteriaceae bacterium]
MAKAKDILQKLRDKYRLVILNDKTFEEKASVRLSRLNVFILLSVAIVLFTATIGSLIVLTPLREYIPGYADVSMRRDLVDLFRMVDSLETSVRQRDALLGNIRQVIDGKVGEAASESKDSFPTPDVGMRYEVDILNMVAPFDSLLRLQMERENVELRLGAQTDNRRFAGVTFFRPVEGQLVRRYAPQQRYHGVGLLLSREEGVKATLDGSVIYTGFSFNEQHVICVQHANNLVSWYKQMNQSLKNTGDYVRAGEVIGIGGGTNSGTRPIQFEFQLWYNGLSLDPAKYINF